MAGLFDSPGLLGGVAGLALGLVEWLAFTAVIAPRIEARARAAARQGQRHTTALPALRAAFLLSSFVALPVAGYVAGALVLPAFGVGTGG